MSSFNYANVDASWQDCFTRALAEVNQLYLDHLTTCHEWLPGPNKIFNAFSLPLNQVNYVLFGESPYPRVASANGYAFWDDCVTELWSPQGLSKKINRATSMRNIMKMLLIAEGALDPEDTSQPAIAAIDKSHFVQTNQALFTNFLSHGFLLLNATLVLQKKQNTSKQKDAKCWQPFLKEVLNCLTEKRPDITYILFGNIARQIDALFDPQFKLNKLYAEHPYNHSFVYNQTVIDFFKPLHLLSSNPESLKKFKVKKFQSIQNTTNEVSKI